MMYDGFIKRGTRTVLMVAGLNDDGAASFLKRAGRNGMVRDEEGNEFNVTNFERFDRDTSDNAEEAGGSVSESSDRELFGSFGGNSE